MLIRTLLAAASVLAAGGVAAAAPTQVTVKIENLAPEGGTFLTPLWVNFSNGSFDTFSAGSAVSPGFERLVEDGSTRLADSPFSSISEEFRASAAGMAGGVDDALPANVGVGRPGFGVLAPGQSLSKTFTLDSDNPATRYFNYASMVIPSNDLFIGNDHPMALPLFDSSGRFIGANVLVRGADVWDAGSEVNNEAPADTAFFGQAGEDIGVVENGVVTRADGFLPRGSGGILDDPMFAAADFTAPGYQLARITVTAGSASAVPLPPGAWMGLGLLSAIAAVGAARRRMNRLAECRAHG